MPAPAAEGWLQLVERLQSRLGSGAVHGLGTHADHRPERAFCRVVPGTEEFESEKKSRRTPGPGPCGCSMRRAASPKGSSRCSPGRSGSSRAGGTAPRRGATTSSPAPGNPRWHGSTGSGKGAWFLHGSLPEPSAASPDYAELHCLSNFSFLRGASHAEELVGARRGARLRGARAHRRMLAGGNRARARRGEGSGPQADRRQRDPRSTTA